jgi:hypothetical protein
MLVTGVLAGMGGAFQVLKDAIASSHVLTDKWEEVIMSAKEGYSAFLRTIASGDWSNLFINLNQAVIAGREYAKTLDEISERQASLNIVEAESRMKILDLMRISKDRRLSDEQRAAAAKQALDLESGLLEKRSKLSWTAFKNDLQLAAAQTGLTEATVANYVKQRDANNELVKKAENYLELQKELEVVSERSMKTRGGANAIDRQQMDILNDQIGKISTSVKVYAKEVVEKMGKGEAKATIDNISKSYTDIYNKQNEFKEGTRRLWSTYTTLLKSIRDEQVKKEDANNKETKSIEKLTKGSIQYIEQLKIIAALTGIDLIGSTDQLPISRMTPAIDPGFDKPDGKKKMEKIDAGGSVAGMNRQDFKTDAELLLDEERKAWMDRLEMTASFVNSIKALTDTIYSNQFQKLDEAANADQVAKEKELKAAGDNQKKKDEIEAKYRQKEEAREKERKKALHDQAVYNKAISATQVIINTAVMAMRSSSIIESVAVIALGAIQLAAVLAQNIPSYKKGRKGGPAEFAKVHEGELIRYPDGSFKQTPAGETTTFLPKNADVIPAHEVSKMAGRYATRPIGNERQSVVVNFRDQYGKEMLGEMRKKKTETRIIDLGNRVVYQEGNYSRISSK